MSGSFSGKMSVKDKPVKHYKHAPIEPDTTDLRVNVLQEYIEKVPNATIQNLKNALNHFSKSTEEEFRNLVKLANISKYDELYPIKSTTQQNIIENVISTDVIRQKSDIISTELQFIQKYPNLDGTSLYKLYKQYFPNSERKQRFIRDFRFHQKRAHKSINQSHQKHIISYTNQQLVAQTIRSLYNAGFTPDTISNVKPVINEILAQNGSEGEIELAIAYLKS